MKKIHARQLLKYYTTELFDILCIDFILIFDDGEEIITNPKAALYSSFFWDFHRQYPNTPLLYKHHVDSILNGKLLDAKTHKLLLENVFFDVIKTYNFNTRELQDPLIKNIYRITNDIYNKLIQESEKYVSSVDILDFLNIVDNKLINEALDKVEPSKESIPKLYETIFNVINTDDSLVDNNIAFAIKTKSVNSNQVLQTVGVRGYLTDIDGSELHKPVMRGYLEGLRTYYNYLAESRSSAKSLYFSESPLQNVSFFSRRLELLCSSVTNLDHTDCHSDKYLIWNVKDNELRNLVGKYYLDEKTNRLNIIRETDKHLINKTIRLRSVLTCTHQDPHSVCEVCFREMLVKLPDTTNLGIACCSALNQEIIQKVLSTKHFEFSSSSEPINLNKNTSRFFRNGEIQNSYYFKEEIKDYKPFLKVPYISCSGLTDLLLMTSIDNVTPNRISSINFIGLDLTINNNKINEILDISVNKNKGVLTKDFLLYIIKNGYESDNNNFIFNLNNWDFSLPVIKMPEVEYNYSNHSKKIASVIEGKMKDLVNRSKSESPQHTLIELFDIVNSKMSAHLSLLEVIIYAIMIDKAGASKYGLARNSSDFGLGVSEFITTNRSLAPAYGFKNQPRTINNPYSFFKLDKPDNPMDVFICPKEVIEYEKVKSNKIK